MLAQTTFMKNKKIQNLIYVIIFLAIIVAPMFVWEILNMIDSNHTGIMKVVDFDLNEKRNKATMSEIIDVSRLTYEVENYYNDRVPFRSVLITLKRNIDTELEKPYKNGIEKALLKVTEIEPHYQVIISRPNNLDEIELQVESTPQLFSDDVTELMKIRDKISDYIKNEIGINVKVTLVEPKSLPRSTAKAVRVIDKRNLH